MSADAVKSLLDRVIQACQNVIKCLGDQHLEAIYQAALEVECQQLNLQFVRQPRIPVMYKGWSVGCVIPDMIVSDQATGCKIIVEIKRGQTKIPTLLKRQQLAKYFSCCEPLHQTDAAIMIQFQNPLDILIEYQKAPLPPLPVALPAPTSAPLKISRKPKRRRELSHAAHPAAVLHVRIQDVEEENVSLE